MLVFCVCWSRASPGFRRFACWWGSKSRENGTFLNTGLWRTENAVFFHTDRSNIIARHDIMPSDSFFHFCAYKMSSIFAARKVLHCSYPTPYCSKLSLWLQGQNEATNSSINLFHIFRSFFYLFSMVYGFPSSHHDTFSFSTRAEMPKTWKCHLNCPWLVE